MTADPSPIAAHAFDPSLSPFAVGAPDLIEAGYHVLPIIPRDKAPGEFRDGQWKPMKGWNSYATAAPSDASIDRWLTWPDANIGVALGKIVGGYQLAAIDFDTDSDDELELLQSQIPPSRMMKRGARGFTAFYRVSRDVRTKRYMIADPTTEHPNKKRCVLEILTGNAPRQTVMPPSVHPNGMAYEYVGAGAIVPVDQLPILTDDHFERLEDTLEHMGWNGEVADRRERASPGAPASLDDPNIWRETNNLALEKMHAWVGELGLPKLRRLPNGSWEAVPAWRPSNEGRHLTVRKPNLKFHRDGIKDMGTDVGYTPIDVCQAAFQWDFETSFLWLRKKLGLLLDDDIFQPPPPPMQLLETDDGLLDTQTGELLKVPSQADDCDEIPDHLLYPQGLVGEIADWIEDTAVAPNRVMALGAAIVVVGTLCGRRDVGPTLSGTHQYVLALAPSGAGKQHPMSQALRLMKAADADELIGPGEFMSGTAIVTTLINSPLCLCAIDEFGAYIKKINSRRAGTHEQQISKFFRQVWGLSYQPYYVPAWADPSILRSRVVKAPAMSIFGVSTPGEFFDSLGSGDVENGFLNRFLVLSSNKRSAEDREPLADPRIVPDGLATKLSELYKARQRPLFIPDPASTEPETFDIPWGDDAKDIYITLKQEIRAVQGEGDIFYARTAEMAVRLATISAVGRGEPEPVVSARDMAWGRDLAMWSADRLAKDATGFISDTSAGAMWAKITGRLQRSGGSMSRRDLARSIKLNPRELNESLSGMSNAGLIRFAEIPTDHGGPPKKMIILTEQQPARRASRRRNTEFENA